MHPKRKESSETETEVRGHSCGLLLQQSPVPVQPVQPAPVLLYPRWAGPGQSGPAESCNERCSGASCVNASSSLIFSVAAARDRGSASCAGHLGLAEGDGQLQVFLLLLAQPLQPLALRPLALPLGPLQLLRLVTKLERRRAVTALLPSPPPRRRRASHQSTEPADQSSGKEGCAPCCAGVCALKHKLMLRVRNSAATFTHCQENLCSEASGRMFPVCSATTVVLEALPTGGVMATGSVQGSVYCGSLTLTFSGPVRKRWIAEQTN